MSSFAVVALAVVTLTVASTSAVQNKPAPPLTAGQATGGLTVNGTVLTIRHAVALAAPYSFDPSRRSLTIVLTPQAVPPSALKAKSLDLLLGSIKQGLIVEMGPDEMGPGSQYSLMLRHPSVKDFPELARNGTFSPNDSRIETRTADRIAGTVTSSFGGREDEIFGQKVQFVLRYHAPVGASFTTR